MILLGPSAKMMTYKFVKHFYTFRQINQIFFLYAGCMGSVDTGFLASELILKGDYEGGVVISWRKGSWMMGRGTYE